MNSNIDCSATLFFVRRFYINDPTIWYYSSPLFRTLAIAFLRLEAWDLEVSFDGQADLPINFTSIPRWKSPETDIDWFHGFRVVLCGELDTVP